MKELNLKAIRKVLKRERITSKPRLAELSGLSVVTIGALVKELCQSGELLEDSMISSTGGRPAVSYRYNGEYRLVLVICMHEHDRQDKAFVTVHNLYGECLSREVIPVAGVSEEFFADVIGRYRQSHPAIGTIAFGMPGSEVEGTLLLTDYEELRGHRFSGYFRDRFHLPVVIENDVNAAILGYCDKNRIGPRQCVIGIYLPRRYPPGSAVYVNGGIHRGRDGIAGEVSLLPMGADWDGYNYAGADAVSLLTEITLPITVLYNPDEIVLYGDWLTQGLIREVRTALTRHLPEKFLPEIGIQHDIGGDFLDGMVHLALLALEPGTQSY